MPSPKRSTGKNSSKNSSRSRNARGSNAKEQVRLSNAPPNFLASLANRLSTRDAARLRASFRAASRVISPSKVEARRRQELAALKRALVSRIAQDIRPPIAAALKVARRWARGERDVRAIMRSVSANPSVGAYSDDRPYFLLMASVYVFVFRSDEGRTVEMYIGREDSVFASDPYRLKVWPPESERSRSPATARIAVDPTSRKLSLVDTVGRKLSFMKVAVDETVRDFLKRRNVSHG